MPRAIRDKSKKLNLPCDDSEDSFTVEYTNMGEPYREGIQIGISNADFREEILVMLRDYEAKELRDLLLSHYPLEGKK